MKTTYVYRCITRNCKEYHVEYPANMGPAEIHYATGRPACCDKCFQPMSLVRVERVAA